MSFVLQRPGKADLLGAINAAAAGADKGGGVFAFATRKGVELLLDVPNLKALISAGREFQLIVGVDAITNPDALLLLEDRAEESPSLSPRAFLHDYAGTFHPKFCWFRHGTKLTVIAGSGNLTTSGLGNTKVVAPPLGNWEAFASQTYEGHAATEALAVIEGWLAEAIGDGVLRPVSDQEVREQAVANSRLRLKRPDRPRKPKPALPAAAAGPAAVAAAPSGPALPVAAAPPAPAPPEVVAGEVVAVPAATASEILIDDLAAASAMDVMVRELSQTRKGQADITLHGLTFLGFKGTSRKVLLQYVALDNTLDEVVEQPLFVNASSNYRVELRPIAHLGYTKAADDSRLILIAVKLGERSFRYTLVPVDSAIYGKVSALLGPIAGAANRRMRSRTLTSNDLHAAVPEIPPNLLPVVGIGLT